MHAPALILCNTEYTHDFMIFIMTLSDICTSIKSIFAQTLVPGDVTLAVTKEGFVKHRFHLACLANGKVLLYVITICTSTL